MSRHVLPPKKLKGKLVELAYGHDHATGWFYQVFDLEAEDEDDDVLADKCELFDKLELTELVEVLQEHEAPRAHVLLVSQGIPI